MTAKTIYADLQSGDNKKMWAYAQEERNWKAKRKREGRDGQNFMYNKFDKEKYRSNYDNIDWSK